MHVLLLTTSKKSPDAFIARMAAKGITYTVEPLTLPTRRDKKKREFEQAYIDELAASIYARHAENIDLVQLFLDRKDWQMTNAVKGIQWHRARSGYQMAAVNDYWKGYDGTLEHEMLHSADNIVRIYTGVELAAILGVRDFDDDVVHRRGPKGGRYLNTYEDIYPIIMPFIQAAVAKRRQTMQVRLSLMAQLAVLYRQLVVAQNGEEVIDDAPEPELPAPVVPDTVEAPTDVKRKKLYDVAYSCLGKNMTAADVPTHLGCASSLNNVFKKAFGKEIGGGASTYNMLKALEKDARFYEVTSPLPGDIVMNASGTSTKGFPTGHVGVWGKNSVMSNNSFTAKWDAHYTLSGWRDFFEKQRGFPTRFFRLRD